MNPQGLSFSEFQVRSGPLAVIVGNAVTFCDDTMPVVRITFGHGILTVTASDGFVAIQDSADLGAEGDGSPSDEGDFYVSLDTATDILKFAKGVKDLKTRPGWIQGTLTTVSGGQIFSLREISTGEEVSFDTIPVSRGIASRFSDLEALFALGLSEGPIAPTVVAIHPERLRDVARIRVNAATTSIRDVYPLDLKFVQNPRKPQAVCLVKFGPTARLVIAGINRERVIETLEAHSEGDSRRALWRIRSEGDQPHS